MSGKLCNSCEPCWYLKAPAEISGRRPRETEHVANGLLGIYRSSPVSVSDAMDTTLLDVEL